MNLGYRLKTARLKRGYSLRKLGALIRISAPSISAWETGKANPTFENLSTVADLLAISFEWLCTGKGDMDLIVYEEIPLFEKMSAEWIKNEGIVCNSKACVVFEGYEATCDSGREQAQKYTGNVIKAAMDKIRKANLGAPSCGN